MPLDLLLHRFMQTDKQLVSPAIGQLAGHVNLRGAVNSATTLRLRGADERRA